MQRSTGYSTSGRRRSHIHSETMPLLHVCATTDAGLWSTGTTGDPAPLVAKVRESGGNFTVACNQIGQSPGVHWANSPDANLFPITGLSAELLLIVLKRMGPDFDCVVHLLPTYSQAIYATTRQKACDMAFGTFSNTAARGYCGAEQAVVTGVNACRPYNPNVTWQDGVTAADACCCDFGYPLVLTKTAALVLYEVRYAKIAACRSHGGWVGG